MDYLFSRQIILAGSWRLVSTGSSKFPENSENSDSRKIRESDNQIARKKLFWFSDILKVRNSDTLSIPSVLKYLPTSHAINPELFRFKASPVTAIFIPSTFVLVNRGAKPRRRYGRSGAISLLSPG